MSVADLTDPQAVQGRWKFRRAQYHVLEGRVSWLEPAHVGQARRGQAAEPSRGGPAELAQAQRAQRRGRGAELEPGARIPDAQRVIRVALRPPYRWNPWT